MQLAHPLVLTGVLEHSVFVSDPSRRLERLRSTVESMLLLTFGTEEQIQRTADKINHIHDRVHGRLNREQGIFAAGTWYTAHDPELLRWVHATLLDVLPRTYEAFVGPLTAAEKDRYCAESTSMERLLQMPAGWLPGSMAELRDYMERIYASGAIQVTERALWMAGEILALPAPLPQWRTLRWLNALPTWLLLPAPLRKAYGCPWGRPERAGTGAMAAIARCVAPRIPALMRHWPASRRPVA